MNFGPSWVPQCTPNLSEIGPGGVLRRDPETRIEKVCNIGSKLRPWTLPNCVRVSKIKVLAFLGNRVNSAPNLAPCGGPWGAKWHQFGGSGAMSKAGLLPGASKRHPEAQGTGGGDPTGGQTGPRGGGQQEEGKDLRRLVDPKGSADNVWGESHLLCQGF